MENNATQPKIVIIGSDERMTYLLKRYTEQSQCSLLMHATIPAVADILAIHPAAVIFLSMEILQTINHNIDALLAKEIFVIACVSAAEEALARESGADACLVHPFTYEEFWATVSAACPAEVE
ncbi:MAG: hypothetical protein JEZ00_14500 [Anaerolineaceae bacterium]|nr:hypothetical protein [Anaerolineaceae bacterium]